MKKIIKFLQVMIACLLSVVLLFNFALMFAGWTNEEKIPTVLGFSQAIVISGSMEPTISAGDVAVYRVADEYSVGDVVIFSQGSEIITHRIIKIEDDGFTTQGDANNVADTWIVSQDNIFVKLVFVVPNIGAFASFLKTGAGTIFIIIMIVAIVEVPRLYDKYTAKRRKDE